MTPLSMAELDDFLAAFESAREAGGDAPLSDFLPPPSHPLYPAVLGEMVRVDLEYAWRAGAPRPLSDYLEAFPALAADPVRLRDVAFEEYRLRVLAGQHPSLAEYSSRFGVDTSGWFVPSPSSLPANPTRRIDSTKPPPDREADFSVAAGVTVCPSEFPAPGETVAGFRLVRELGRGSFGRVFLAEQEQLVARPTALKLTPLSLVGEARTMARLQHANIVPIYSLHRVGGFAAICMPYLGGTTLAELLRRLRREPALPTGGRWLGERFEKMSHVEAVLWMGARLAEGLAHAHERGVVHRDVKPANVLLAADGTPMLLDFNLAEETDAAKLGEYALAGGTLPYMAPEYMRGLRDGRARSDPRGDLFALGLVLYELLTGKFPFPDRRGQFAAVLPDLIADRRRVPDDVTRRNPDASPAVGAIVGKCLEPDPARRYQSAMELREDLQRHLEHWPLRYARERSWRERGRKWRRRHPRLLSWVTVLSFAAVLTFGAGALLYQQGERLKTLRADRMFHEVDQARREVPALLAAPDADPAQLRDGAARCQAVAEMYGVMDEGEWREQPAYQNLPAADRTRLERALAELLWLWSRAEAWAGHDEKAWRVHLAARDCCPKGELPGVLKRQAAQRGEQPAGTPFPPAREQFLDLLDRAEQGRPREMIPRLNAITLDEVDNPTVWLLLARAYAENGQHETAVVFSGMAARQAPEWPWAWYVRGSCCLIAKEWRGAADAFENALKRKPDLGGARTNRAIALLELGETRAAIAELDLAIESGIATTQALFQRSVAKARIGDHEGARRDHAEGLRLEPTDELSCLTRGFARLPGDPAGSLADFDRALAINPRSRLGLRNRAHVLSEHLGRTVESVKCLDRLLDLYPDDLLALGGRGVLLGRLGRRDAAVRDAEALLRAKPEPGLVYQAACVYALSARKHPMDRDEALRLLRQACAREAAWVEVAPRDPDLAALHSDPAFQQALRSARELHRVK